MTRNTHALLRIGHLTFWGGLGDEGFFVDPDGFEGWHDAPTTRQLDVEIPAGHGSYDAAEFYDARIVTVSGYCHARTADRLGQFRSELVAVLQGRVKLRVDDIGSETFAYGRRFGQPKFQVDHASRRARFQFSVRCADPLRYGERTPLRVTGPGEAQPIYHRGNFPSAPQLLVRGAMPGYRVEGPGSTFVVGQAVTAERPHLLDTATGLLSINGEVQLGAITSGTGWVIAPGTIPVTHKLVPVSGTGTLETIIRAAIA